MTESFTHSGDLGDIIYALPAIRACGGGVLELFDTPGRTTHAMTPERAALVIPLIELQPYIRSCRWVERPDHDHALNGFRDHRHPSRNIADMHLATIGKGSEHRATQWLTVDRATRVRAVVVHRSPRYNNPRFPWREIVDMYGEDIVFVGLPDEHADFCRRFGAVAYHATASLLEVARVIAGAELFIGGQSCGAAIAEGLKHRMILEICPWQHDCYFERMGRMNGWDDSIELPGRQRA